MISRSRSHDRLATLAPWLVSAVLFAASMAVAATWPPPAGPDGSFSSGLAPLHGDFDLRVLAR